MRHNLVLLFVLLILLILHSCDPHEDSALNFTAIESELLQDSALEGQEELIGSILQFYKKELPLQFSRRIIVTSGDDDPDFLDAMAVSRIDSFREYAGESLKFGIREVTDLQVLDEEYLINSIRYALTSAGQYPWNQKIPDSIFLNYLLPYKVVHEYPGTWWKILKPYYRDSLAVWASPSITGFDANDTDTIEKYTVSEPRGLPMWWRYDDQSPTFTKYPSLKEILLLEKGGCYLGAMINVLILRTCGIPATIDEAPYWGSRNGSHASEVIWNTRQQKMLAGSGLEFYDQQLNHRAPKVIRYTYRYTGAYSDMIAPYLNDEKLQIPQMTGDHWYDATAYYNAVSDIHIPVGEKISEKEDLGYIYVMDYGHWVPVSYGIIQRDSLSFTSMGREVIYRAGYYSGGEHHFITRPFLLDTLGVIRYSDPDTLHTMTIQACKINHGKEAGVASGQTYTLQYLGSDGVWKDHNTKICKSDGELSFSKVPVGAFYILHSPSDKRNLARIFLVNEKGEQLWY